MSLVVWLPLNGDLHNQGLNQDLTISNHNATINNNGKIGKCYYFNGNQQWLQFNSSLGNFYNNDWSITCWIKPTDRTRSVILSDYIAVGASNIALELSTTGYVRVYWNGAPDINFISAGILPLNEWTHLTVTKQNRDIKVYFNGEWKQTYTHTADFSTQISNAYPRIGDDYRGNSNNTVSYQGYLNDFRMYNHALSPKEVEEIAKGLVLHYKLDNNGMGGDNLALNTRKLNIACTKNNLYMSNRGYSTLQLRNDGFYEVKCTGDWQGLSFFANQLNLSPGTKVTYSFYIYGNGSSRNLTFFPLMFNSAGTRDQSTGLPISIDGGAYTTVNAKAFSNITATSPEYHYVTFEWNQAVANIITNGGYIVLSIQVYGTWNSEDWACIFAPKLEIGNKPTAWSPAKSELGDMATTVYDCSGYSNNGTIISNLGTVTPSPRYDVATVFNGSSSAIKVNDNNWCSQGMEQMTINVWVKASSWPANTRIFSCTESGGFNTEGGDSGYYRFPVCVYTNANKTGQGYKYGGQEIKISDLSTTDWNMLTFVYDLTGTKTYINGELHYTYNNTSYGIYFNMDARLFLGCEAALASPSSPYFNGQESDFRIYATALSAQQIKELYTTSMQIDSSGNVFARELVEL